MTFAIDEAYLPATLSAPAMTDQEFAALCAEHPDLQFETTAEGELIVMAPTFTDTSNFNFNVAVKLGIWAEKDARGLCSDSQGLFVFPNGARRAPDASWTLKSRITQLGSRRKKSFWPLCPDFVIEINSDSDRLKRLREKMREYIDQGAQLGWLINPDDQTVEIYRPGGHSEQRTSVNKIEGEGPVAGFVLDLTNLWDPLA